MTIAKSFAIRDALEVAGIELLDGNENGAGPGARLKSSVSEGSTMVGRSGTDFRSASESLPPPIGTQCLNYIFAKLWRRLLRLDQALQ
jgi:hypothetical protein